MTHRWMVLMTTIVLALALVACGGARTSYDEPAEAEPAEATPAAPAGNTEPSEAMLAALAVADRADGDEDQVVGNCAGCGLAMEGSDEHALHVGDYAMHFCSDSCRGKFSEDVEASLVALSSLSEEEAPVRVEQ